MVSALRTDTQAADDRLRGVVVSIIVFCSFLALYVATLLPGVLPADAGEFQLVAETAGIAHPPGYPLYTMLAWLFTRIPIGPGGAWRVNVFSAVTAAATLSLVFATARKLTRSLLGGLVAVLALGSATTFWATATQASIRPLTSFFMALGLYTLTHHASWVAGHASAGRLCGEDAVSGPYVILFSLGLSLGLTHHPSLAFPGAVFVVYLVLIDRDLLRCPRLWVKPAAAAVLSLVVLLYLPLRGAPDLAEVSGFLDHVMARGFRGDMFALSLLDRLVILPTLFRFQFNLALLLGMLAGAALITFQDWKLALLLIGTVVLHTSVTLTYDAPQTVEYATPAYVSLALLVSVPFARIPDLVSQRWPSEAADIDVQPVVRAVSALVLVILSVAGVLNLLGHLPSYRRLSESNDARDYVETVLRSAPPDAVVLSNWHWFSPLRYLIEVEGRRSDVDIEYVAPRGEPLAETWVAQIEEQIGDRPVVVVRYFESAYGELPYRFEPLGEAFLVRREPSTTPPDQITPLDATLGQQIQLLGYRVEASVIEPAQPLSLILAWSPLGPLEADIALFAQLIGPEGRLWSATRDPRHGAEAVPADEVIIDHFVVYPFLHASPGEYDLVVGAYSADGRLSAEDGSEAVQIATVRLTPSTTPPVTEHPRFVRFHGGLTLIGTDHDIPEEGHVRTYLHWAGPGEAVDLHLTAGDDSVVSASRVPALRRGEYATVALDRPDIPARLTVLVGGESQRWNLLFGGPVRLPEAKPGARYVPVANAMVLTGFDARFVEPDPGSVVSLQLHLRSQRALERDFIVSTALTGLLPDGTWAWRASHDTVPVLGAIPTLKWIRDSEVLDPHRVIIPQDASAAPVVGSFLVYDHFTQRPLPPLDERLVPHVDLRAWQSVSQ